VRVLCVTPHVFAGGAEKGALNLAHHLNTNGCQVRIATLSVDVRTLPSHLAKLPYALPETPVASPRMEGVSAVVTSMLRELHALVGVLKTCVDEFDLLNVYNFPAYWASSLVKNGSPVIWTCSEVLGPYGQTKDLYDRSPLFRAALTGASVVDQFMVDKGVDAIVTCSELNRSLIKDRYGRDALVIPTGVDYAFFSTEVPDARARFELGEGPLLLQVGALIQRKRQIASIRALKRLQRGLGGVKLVIVGEGPWKPILEEEVRKLQLEADVIFMGKVSEEALRGLYHACDVNLFPGRDQTWGLVPFEALAAGTPSIVAEDCGAAAIIEREGIGFVVNPSVADLVEAVTGILRHPAEVADVVRRGQGYVEKNLNWERYASEVYGVFRDAYEQKNGGSR